MSSRMYISLVASVVLISVLGCQGGDAPQKAGGKVLVDGKPVTNGSVQFYPVEGGRSATASIQKDGTFVVSYRKAGDGLPVGEYLVAITATKFTPNKSQSKQPDGEPDIAGMEIFGRTTPIVPSIYNSFDTTPLRQVVSDSNEPQNFIFDIPKKRK